MYICYKENKELQCMDEVNLRGPFNGQTIYSSFFSKTISPETLGGGIPSQLKFV